MRIPWLKTLSIALAMGIALLANHPALADGPDDIREWEVASDQEIHGMRGGYVNGEGLEVSFGIEQAVYINGILQAANTPYPGVTLTQNGSGNTFLPADPGPFQSGFFNVIQNSMDQQVIQNINKINATISVLGLYKEIHQANTLNQQLIQSLR
ncbi:MAG: hypothetical protein WBX50_00640 [Candidatus Deferrimicrobiaceae bacterium]